MQHISGTACSSDFIRRDQQTAQASPLLQRLGVILRCRDLGWDRWK